MQVASDNSTMHVCRQGVESVTLMYEPKLFDVQASWSSQPNVGTLSAAEGGGIMTWNGHNFVLSPWLWNTTGGGVFYTITGNTISRIGLKLWQFALSIIDAAGHWTMLYIFNRSAYSPLGLYTFVSVTINTDPGFSTWAPTPDAGFEAGVTMTRI